MRFFALSKLFLGYIFLVAVIPCWAAAPRALACTDLAKMQIENATISEAVDVPAGKPVSVGGVFTPPVAITSLPAHCLVHGEVNHHQGANGLQGPVTTPTAGSKSALSLGYALVTTDGGHRDPHRIPPDGTFGSDPDARADHNYRSTKLVTDAARKVIAQYYGSPIKYSYLQGCSNGGREGLMTAERYPDYFDGIIAGAPAFNLTHAAIAEAWNTVQLASIAPKKPDGTPDLTQSLTEPDLKLLVSAVLDKCDALD